MSSKFGLLLRKLSALVVTFVVSLMVIAPSTALADGWWSSSLSTREGGQNSQSSLFGFLKSMVVVTTSVNTTTEMIKVRRMGTERNVDASNAAVIIVNLDGIARNGTISDLRTNVMTHFFVRQHVGRPWAPLDASLIVQLEKNRTVFVPPIVNPPANHTVPVVQFQFNGSSYNETTTQYLVPIVLSSPAPTNIHLMYRIGGTAVRGNDYTIDNVGEVMIPAGQTTATIPVKLLSNNSNELGKTVVLSLSTAGSNATIGTMATFTLTIKDSDRLALNFESAGQLSNEANVLFPVKVTLPQITTRDVTVQYSVHGNATGGGVDYSLLDGVVVIPAGSLSSTINLTINDDLLDEANETVIISLYAPTNASLGLTHIYTHTILDND